MKKNDIEKTIFSKLYSKYKSDNTIYTLNIIDNIIFNERSHLVSKFKDYLIFDDEFEFFKRYYIYKESIIRLKTLFNYYSKKKIQCPNYSNLKEGDFILNNIFSKIKIVENLEKSYKERKKEKINLKNNMENLSNTVFNSKVYDSIINDSENCLSLFSYDKESMYSEYNNNLISSNKNKGNDVDKLIKNIEDADPDVEFSFKKNINKKLVLNDSLIKDLNLNLEINPGNTNLTEIPNNSNIYKKKKTPTNSLSKRKNNGSNSSKGQKHIFLNKNENIDYINYKNMVLFSDNNRNRLCKEEEISDINRKIKSNNKSKKIKLNTIMI